MKIELYELIDQLDIQLLFSSGRAGAGEFIEIKTLEYMIRFIFGDNASTIDFIQWWHLPSRNNLMMTPTMVVFGSDGNITENVVEYDPAFNQAVAKVFKELNIANLDCVMRSWYPDED